MPHALRLRPAAATSSAPATSPLPTVAAPRHERGLRAWWARNVVAMDPHPATGRLDELDRRSTPGRLHPAAFSSEVERVA